MTKTVTLRQIEVDKNNQVHFTTTSNDFEIQPIRPAQFGALTKVINATLKDLQTNENFKKTVTQLFGEYAEGFDLEELFRSNDFNIFNVLDAVGFLLEAAPERLSEIISIMADIDRVTIEYQDMDKYFDLVEAVIEVNDIEKLVARIKKLSSTLGKTFKFLNRNQQQPKTVPTQKQG